MKSTEVDSTQFFALQITTLKLCGLWFYISHPITSIRFWLSILKRVFIGITVFIIPPSAQIAYMVKLCMQGNAEIQEVAAMLNLILAELMASSCLFDLFLHRQIFMELINQLTNKEFQFHLAPQKDILEKSVASIKKVFWVLIIVCPLDVIIQTVIVPGLNNFKVLPLKMDFIWFDINKESYHIYVFAYQVLYKPPIVFMYIAVITLSWAAMSCTISQLDILNYNIKNMQHYIRATMTERQCDKNTAFHIVFKKFMFHHSCIIRFVKTLQKAFGGQLSATLFLNAFIIGSTAVQIVSIDVSLNNVTNVVWTFGFLFIFTSLLFIDCYFANSVTYKSQQIYTLIFSFCPWIDLPMSLKKDVLLFLAKTQQPVVITAAKIVPVSLDTFTKVMNWTYKGFAVMNQMKK